MLVNICWLKAKNTPKGIRIPVCSVKGSCPRPLDDGGSIFTNIIDENIKRATRFERATSTLARSRSTTELCPLIYIYIILKTNKSTVSKLYCIEVILFCQEFQ